MSEKRVSNETLGKVIVQVVKELEKSLKTAEKSQREHEENLGSISKDIAKGLHYEINRLDAFSVDLRPLDDKMNNYLEQINKVSEDARKELKSPILGLKVLGLVFGLFLSVLVFFFFFNEQAKELKKERAAKEHFIRFIESDEKIIKQYENWAK